MTAGSAAGAGYRHFLAQLESVRTLGVALGLDRIRDALARLGHPEASLVGVQVAGTNGKGSCAAMSAAVLRAHGLRVGLYTSPHLVRFTERIRVDNREVDGDALAEHGDAVLATGVPLTYFEVATLVAVRVMAAAGVDAVIWETGLGGRLDAVTALPVVGTAITSIGLDHTDLLGDSIEAIAAEKAGIARSGVPLLVGPVPAAAAAVIERQAAVVGAPVRRYPGELAAAPAPALAGAHQRTNAALATALAGLVLGNSGQGLRAPAVAQGLAEVQWPGRLEWITPDVLLDGAHNAEGAAALAAYVGSLPVNRRPRALVLSLVRGKDHGALLAALAALWPDLLAVVVTRSMNPRALPPAELAAAVRAAGAPAVEVAATSAEALQRARQRAAGAPVLVAGSLFLVGETRAALTGEPVDPVVTGDPLP